MLRLSTYMASGLKTEEGWWPSGTWRVFPAGRGPKANLVTPRRMQGRRASSFGTKAID